jgi:AcrR family transcriptional regulator
VSQVVNPVLDLGAEVGVSTRVIAAAVRCIGRWGVAKTTLDDVAREAGYSRATVYRAFPGGRDALMEVVAASEVDAFLDRLERALGQAGTVDEALVAGITEAGRTLASHPALRFLLAHEPEVILPRLCFAEMDAVLARVVRVSRAHLARWLSGRQADELAEWAARVTLSYAMCPSPAVNLADTASVRRLVSTFVRPALVTI